MTLHPGTLQSGCTVLKIDHPHPVSLRSMKPSFAFAALTPSWTGSFPKVDVSILFAGDELTKSRQEGWDSVARGELLARLQKCDINSGATPR